VKDTILDELHKRRLERGAAFKHDIDAMVKDLQRREAESRRRGVKFVTPRKRRKSRVG
jgi:hypothetical protein